MRCLSLSSLTESRGPSRSRQPLSHVSLFSSPTSSKPENRTEWLMLRLVGGGGNLESSWFVGIFLST